MGLKFGFVVNKIRCKFAKKIKGYEIMNNYYRRGGAHIGKNCAILSNLDFCEKQLLYIGNDVTVSSDVLFVTHDASLCKHTQRSGALFGKIIIGNNCFIGQRSMLMYGVTLADDIIVAAGSVVTKSFVEKGAIIGGNPAKQIGTVNEFAIKHFEQRMKLSELNDAILKNDDRLIKK